MAVLPGPDYPRSSAVKPARPRTTRGNVYTSPKPPKRNPKIVGRYKAKPKVNTNLYTVKKRGGGQGYVTIRRPAAAGAAGAAGAAASSAAVAPAAVDPYAGLPDWAKSQLVALDTQETAHKAYAGQVGDWASQALTGLTGVDPAHPGINTTLQQQYLGNVQGVVGGALNAAAAGAMGPQVASTTPGGVASSPTAYLSRAAAEGDYGRSSGMLQAAQAQAAINTLQPNTQAQGYVYALAALREGLSSTYATKRADMRTKIDKFIQESQAAAAKQAESERHNRVTEAISATNASTNAAFQAARLGYDAQGQAFDQAGRTTAAATPAPAGYYAVPDGRGGSDYIRDPNVPQATSGGSGGGGGGGGGTSNKPLTSSQISTMQGKWKRPKSSPPKLGAGWKQPVWDPGTKAWYAKRGPAGKSSAPSATAIAKAKGADPNKVFDKISGSVMNLSIDDTDQNTGTGDLLRILRTLQPTNPKNFANWYAATAPVLRRINPKFEVWMTGYIKRRKAGTGGVSWKGKF